MKRLLRPDEVCELLGISRKTFSRRCEAGFFVVVPAGPKSIRVTTASVRDYLVRQAQARARDQGMPNNIPNEDKWLFPDSEEGFITEKKKDGGD